MVDGIYLAFTLKATRASALIGNYCDRAEHCEVVDQEWVAQAGAQLLELAEEVAAHEDLDLFELYANRLGAIEARNALHQRNSFDGSAAVREGGRVKTSSWRDLQLIQTEHDLHYHPDVLGLAKIDQLRHCAFHLAKLAGHLAARAEDEESGEEICQRRLPDLLLFGLKLHTIIGRRLPDEPFRP